MKLTKNLSLVRRSETHPARIQELHEYILINAAQLKAFRAKLKLIENVEELKPLREKTFEEALICYENSCQARIKMGELLSQLKPNIESGGRSKIENLGKKLPAGISYDESSDAQCLFRNQDVIPEILKEARTKEAIPSIEKVITKARLKEKKPQDFPPEQSPDEEYEDLSYRVYSEWCQIERNANQAINYLARMIQLKPENQNLIVIKNALEDLLKNSTKLVRAEIENQREEVGSIS